MSFIVVDGPDTAASMAGDLAFRVPQKSIDKCCNAFRAGSDDPFNGVIPLLCLGPIGTKTKVTVNTTPTVAAHTFFQFTEGGTIFSETDLGFVPTKENVGTASYSKIDVAPSYVGVYCGDGRDPPRLIVNLQTKKKATVQKTRYLLTGLTAATTYAGIANPGYPPGPNIDAVYNWTDITADAYRHDTEVLIGGSSKTRVEPKKWHHLIWSYLLNDVVTRGGAGSISDNTTSAARMWLALDDKNYTKFDLSDYWPDGSSDANAILTRTGYAIAGQGPWPGGTEGHASTDPENYGVFNSNKIPAGTPTYSLRKPTIPGVEPLGIPATAKFVNNIYQTEFRRMMLFTGVTLDPSETVRRRLFLKEPDKNGVQRLAPASLAAEFFGKEPEIKFANSSAFKAARNQGTANAPKFPAGLKVGGIGNYRPDFNLGGDQGSD